MQHWWTIWQLSKMKQKEILREAEKLRSQEQVARHQKEPSRGFSNFLISLGRSLISWGLFPQERHGASYRCAPHELSGDDR